MSTTIDNRVVEMRFDNKQFESNVQTTMSTLDKLKEKLNLPGASKGLEGLKSSIRNIDMSGLGNAVESVRSKFSALEVMGVTALANITNSAVNAGKRIVSALTIDPIKTGFQEYETQINAVQTILANTQSKGSTLEDVNKALDELNLYADKTIYNFTEMTRNIGTFTAAGVDLDKSVSSIKGIANLAAVSGSTSQQASVAMYQLSQALAAGKVQLQDWNSVVNAGMGGQLFQDALKRTAKQQGENVDALIKKYGSFRESLTKGQWLTTEVLTETLSQLSGAYSEADLIKQGYSKKEAKEIAQLAQTAVDAATKVKTFTQLWDTLKEAAQSGWTQTWEIIVGDFEEAKSLLTEASDYFGDIINKSAQARNDMLEGWAKGGGREMAIEALKNAFEGLLSIIRPIKEAFREVFPPMTSKKLLEITENIRDLTKNFKLTDTQAENLKKVFKGLFSIVNVGWTFIKKLASGIVSLIGNLAGFTDGILSVGGAIGEVFSGFNFDGIISGLSDFWDVIKNIAKGIGDVVSKIGSSLGKSLSDIINNMGIDTITKAIQNGLLGGLILTITKFVKHIRSNMEDAGGILDSVTDLLDGVKDSLKAFQDNIRAKTLLTIAGAVAILAGSLLILSTIDSKKLNQSLSAIVTIFGGLIGAMAAISKFGIGSGKMIAASTAMVGMSVAVLILASALKKLSGLNIDQIETGIIGVLGLTTIVVLASKALATNSEKTIKGALQMVVFATAIKILATACTYLAALSWEQMAKGLIGVGALMGAVSVFMNTAKFSKKAITNALGIVILSGAMKILADVCSEFGNMSWEGIAKGLAAIGGILGELSIFSNLMKNAKGLLKTAVILTVVAGSVRILEKSLVTFSKLSWEGIAKGLVTIAGSLFAVSIAARTMPKQGLIDISVVLPSVASALLIIAKVIKQIGKLSWGELAAGLVGIGVSLELLSRALNKMKGTIPAALSLFVAASALLALGKAMSIVAGLGWEGVAIGLVAIAGALLIIGTAAKLLQPLIPSLVSLSGSIALLGLSLVVFGVGLAAVGAGMIPVLTAVVSTILTLQNVSWSAIAKGLVVIVGVFTTLGIAATLLKPLIPTILSLSGSLLVLSVSCLGIGIAISLVVSSLAALGAMGSDTAQSIVDSLTIIVTGLIGMLPKIIEGLVETVKTLVLSLVDAISECAPAIIDGLLKLAIGILESLKNNVPQIISNLALFIINSLAALAKYVPQIVAVAIDLIIAVINGIAEKLPELVVAVVNLVGKLLDGVIQALNNVDTTNLIKGIIAVGLMTGLMAALSAIVSFIPGAMAGVLGMGLVIGELALVLAAIGALSTIPGLQDFVVKGGNLLQSIGTAIGQFVGGLIGGVMNGMTDVLPNVAVNLSAFMINLEPFIQAAKKIDPSILDGIKSLCAAILLITGTEVVNSIANWFTGGNSMADFANQLVPFGKGIKAYADCVAGIDNAAIVNSANAAKALAEMANIIPNEGGVVGWFAGDNSIANFSSQLISLGIGLKGFAEKTTGIDPKNIINAANAAKALAEMANIIPSPEGIAAWFTGDDSISNFSVQLISLGTGLKSFAEKTAGIDPKNVMAATNAAKALAQMANVIPNEGGVVGWFAGDNSIANFGSELLSLGIGLKGFATVTEGIVAENIIAATNAAKALAEMASTVPNEGGVKAWFTGDNSIANFGSELITLGLGLKGFGEAIGGMNPGKVMLAANAAKAIAEMANVIPNEGGVVAWFSGDNSIANFGSELISLGLGLRGFAIATEGIKTENIISASNAAKALAQMANVIPNEGGVVGWFAGDNSIANFGSELITLGLGLKGFSVATTGIDPNAIIAASNAAKALAQMTNTIPNEGGIKAWLNGESGVASFGTNLIHLGVSLKGFAESTSGINTESMSATTKAAKALVEMTNTIPNEGGVKAWLNGESGVASFGDGLRKLGSGLKGFAEKTAGIEPTNIVAASNAAKSLAQMTKYIPNEGGIKAWFSGESGVSKFSDGLPKLGKALSGFSTSVSGIDPIRIAAASTAAKNLAKMSSTVPKNTDNLGPFGDNLAKFGNKLRAYFANTANITEGAIAVSNKAVKALKSLDSINGIKLKIASTGINDVIRALRNMSSIKANSADGFTKVLNAIAKANINGAIKSFSDSASKLKSAGSNMMTGIIQGMKSKQPAVISAGKNIMTSMVNIFKNKASMFNNVGKEIMDKLNGAFKSNSGKVRSSMTLVLKMVSSSIRSYYSTFYNAGSYLGIGFARGISSSSWYANLKARALASAAAKAAAAELKEHSPSKVGYKIGAFFGLGFVNGIGGYVKTAYETSSEIATSAKKGLTKAISYTKDLMSGALDSQPTIRPVLDLSDVKSGFGEINGMLADGPSVGVSANIDAISSMMSHRNQNGVGNDIVSAIDKLRKDLSNIGNTSYTIEGVTYDDGSNISNAVESIVRAARIERRR